MIPLSQDFISSLSALHGVDSEVLCEALGTMPGVGVRRNHRKDADNPLLEILAGADCTPVSWCGDGYILSERPRFSHDPLWHAGAYYVQDSSSMIYQQLASKIAEKIMTEGSNSQPLRVLDFCAAPGGKTTALINGLPFGTQIVANEFVAQRGKILRENLEKWGYPFVITTGAASSQYVGLPPMFDIVAVDAPCSGEGMMRKDEDARRQWSEGLVRECSSLQKEILTDLADIVRPGGYLIYSTCTFNMAENEENSRFITDTLGFEPVGIASLHLEGIDGGRCGTPLRALTDDVEALRFMPHVTPTGEGQYVSVFKRRDDASDESSTPLPSKKPVKKDKKKGGRQEIAITKKMKDTLDIWIRKDVNPSYICSGNLVTMLPEEMENLRQLFVAQQINVTGSGLPVAEIKGSGDRADLIPDSRLVLSMAYRRGSIPETNLSHEDALRYLQREAITLSPNIPKGYAVVLYEGRPLGLVKNLGNRANNLFPQAWKIRF